MELVSDRHLPFTKSWDHPGGNWWIWYARGLFALVPISALLLMMQSLSHETRYLASEIDFHRKKAEVVCHNVQLVEDNFTGFLAYAFQGTGQCSQTCLWFVMTGAIFLLLAVLSVISPLWVYYCKKKARKAYWAYLATERLDRVMTSAVSPEVGLFTRREVRAYLNKNHRGWSGALHPGANQTQQVR